MVVFDVEFNEKGCPLVGSFNSGEFDGIVVALRGPSFSLSDDAKVAVPGVFGLTNPGLSRDNLSITRPGARAETFA